MNAVINVIKSRRSIRAYKSEPLKQEQLDAIIEAGIFAPTGCNDQPWHFTVIRDRAVISAVNAKCKELMASSDVEWIRSMAANPKADITYGAPVLIIVSARQDAVTGAEDCAAAMQNMLLAAESMDIGSCWLGLVHFIFGSADNMAKLALPGGYEPQYAAVFGYKADPLKKDGPQRNRDVVNYIG
jgi:nitroreductase